ncbi:Aste57867_21847 [Aphanomyces stellatus]|uniref:Aste57867_21847 protein n=1 Tax=Aphanomyces stellatus TaxID=120398 RepID=A0A485LIM2_9STRA|nr:hypothetical protein As57867_021778 [Aphanomyces stellatus]VFT98516.1 Aste57867_21847 [Aphanomyces stellatus]
MRGTVVFVLLYLATCNAGPHLNGVTGVTCSKRSDCGLVPSLGCLNGTCASCVVDADCHDSASDVSKRCVQKDGVAQCLDKNVFSPFTAADVLAAFLAVLATAMGAACGIGGGGLLVPLYIIVVGLNPKYAIPLSKATILGGAVATYWSNFREKHPNASRRPIIDYALAGLMEPMTLIGTIGGVMANAMFPSWLILVLLILLLAFVTYRVTLKANKMYAKENQATPLLLPINDPMEHANHERSVTQECIASTASVEDEPHYTEAPESTTASGNTAESIKRQDILDAEANVFPFKSCILPLLLCILAILTEALLRGGHGAASVVGIACGSALYWLLIVPPAILLSHVAYGFAKRLLRREHLYDQYEIEPVVGDVRWTPSTAYWIFPLQSFIAGIAAALVGIGGGIVQGPVMLEHGVTPLVQSATASYMILYTSTSTTIQYTIAGQFPGALQYDYVLWYVGLGFLGGLMGKTVVEFLIRKTGRMSYFLYFLAINSACQAIAMGYIGIKGVVHDIHVGNSMGFTGLCRG